MSHYYRGILSSSTHIAFYCPYDERADRSIVRIDIGKSAPLYHAES